MGLFSNYNNAGSGVPKMPQEKRGFFKFMEIFGRHFWDLVMINLLYIIFCIPIITFGPATAGLIKVTRNYSQERSCFMFHDFWRAFKSTFKQSFVMGLIDLFLVFWAGVMISFYYSFSKVYPIGKLLLVISISLLLIIYLMHYYIYIMIVSTNLKMKQIIKNAFLLTSLGIKQTLASFFSILGILIIMLMILLTATNAGLIFDLVIIAGLLFSFSAFVVCYNCYPIVRKYVIQPYYDTRGESNPEYDYLRPVDDGDAIFEDKGGKEAPIVMPKGERKRNKGGSSGGSKSKGGGKRIS